MTTKDVLEQLVAELRAGGILYEEAVREFKKRLLLCILNANAGNECKAAREMKMHRNTVRRLRITLQLRRDSQCHSRFITLAEAVYRKRSA